MLSMSDSRAWPSQEKAYLYRTGAKASFTVIVGLCRQPCQDADAPIAVPHLWPGADDYRAPALDQDARRALYTSL